MQIFRSNTILIALQHALETFYQEFHQGQILYSLYLSTEPNTYESHPQNLLFHEIITLGNDETLNNVLVVKQEGRAVTSS